MFWIGAIFFADMGYKWIKRRREGVAWKHHWSVLAVSFLLFLLAEVQFLLKDRWNLPIFFHTISTSIQAWLF
ncbi:MULTISPECIES: hypothetical protein [Paenibacillus]|uniref:hypothetical protein n=1 Tax=Paenibacillus TaxID=44249 RepID=UPI002FE1BE6B